jgi:hypothetical protein
LRISGNPIAFFAADLTLLRSASKDALASGNVSGNNDSDDGNDLSGRLSSKKPREIRLNRSSKNEPETSVV